ncbi:MULTISPECIES: DUF2058 domain-containing protein [unclassified Thioalkalivibrio]|uniref:DUF2058 domain-containing protein n=1 Tax=unclassified Thioalkalivibrio TaxID=2621013 RepID=UPI000365B36B|nr:MULTISPECIES: DUF2058 domain-containing protein [unclassified Thioalkalivibrio]
MSDDLRNQLLKAGLVDEKQVRKAKSQKHKAQKTQPKKKKGKPADAEASAAAARQAAQAQRSREKNQERQEKAERRARRAQIRELVNQHLAPIPTGDAAIDYHFQFDGQIRHLPVTEDTRKRLVDGRAALAGLELHPSKGFRVIPREIADRIRERDAEWPLVIPAEESGDTEPDPDDPYKDYVVPDDLMW